MPPAKTPSGSGQVAKWNYTTAIRIFLDNKNDPTSNFQWVLAEASSSATPGTLNAWHDQEVSWTQTLFQVNLIPDQYLTLLKSEPQNVAGSKTVTTNVGFSVGFNSNGPTGSFSYSNSTTKTIADWRVANNSRSSGSPNKAAWTIASAYPVNGNNTRTGPDVDPDAFCCWYAYYSVIPPNQLSTSNFEYFTQGLWTTNNQVVKDWVTFTTLQRAWYTAAWMAWTDGNHGDSEYAGFMDRYNVVSQPELKVNLAAVVPVPIKSITFSPNPVVAGQTTTATLTLASAAPTDVVVTISSDKPGVAPPHDFYTIPKDQDSISFVVNTGDQGCEPESATISAFYAEGENAILSIDPPPHCQSVE